MQSAVKAMTKIPNMNLDFSMIQQQRVIDQMTCDCGVKVALIEVPILGGPDKGKPMIIKRGIEFHNGARIDCKCEELKIIEKVKEHNQEQVKRNIEKVFDDYSLINPALKTATFGNFRKEQAEYTYEQRKSLQDAYNAASEYVKSFSLDKPSNLFFQGSFGNGKSHLAVSIAKAVKQKGHTAIFISIPKLLTKISSTYNKMSERTEEEIIAKLENADLVVFDDIGAEGETKGWSARKLFEIIDQRSGKHNVFTTNFSSDDFKVNMEAERIFSRLMMNSKPVIIKAPDYRKKQFRAVSSE